MPRKFTEFTSAISLIEDERILQCEKGYGRDHDDKHTDGSILRAAMDILVGVAADDKTGQLHEPPEWVMDLADHVGSKYRSDPIKRLVIAATMISAEIERLQRVQIATKKKRTGR